VLSVLAGAAVASGIAYATIPGSDGVIHACYSANGTGALNVYDPSNTDGSVPTSCIKGQASFAFNQQGPAGPPGPQGPAGHLAPAAVTAIEQNLALIQSGLKQLDAGIAASYGQQRQQRNTFLRLRRRFAAAATVAKKVDDLGEMSDQTSAALQKLMDRHSNFLSTLSNLEKKLADTESALEQNLK
jgi:hypothetical protein